MGDMPPIDVRSDLWPIVRDILRKHVPEHEVWAFGSRVTGTTKQYSDLHLAVIGNKPLPIKVRAPGSPTPDLAVPKGFCAG